MEIKKTGKGGTGARSGSSRTRKAAAGSAKTSARKRGPANAGGVSPEQRHAMIAELAYLRAAERGFVGGDPLTDWLEGEKEVDRRLAGRAD